MLETSQVEHSHTTIGATTHKDINTAGAESHIKDFLVMRDQLRLGSKGGNVPYGTSSVDTGGDDELGGKSIPVERRQWRSMLWSLGIGQECQGLQFLCAGIALICGRRAIDIAANERLLGLWQGPQAEVIA